MQFTQSTALLMILGTALTSAIPHAKRDELAQPDKVKRDIYTEPPYTARKEKREEPTPPVTVTQPGKAKRDDPTRIVERDAPPTPAITGPAEEDDGTNFNQYINDPDHYPKWNECALHGSVADCQAVAEQETRDMGRAPPKLKEKRDQAAWMQCVSNGGSAADCKAVGEQGSPNLGRTPTKE